MLISVAIMVSGTYWEPAAKAQLICSGGKETLVWTWSRGQNRVFSSFVHCLVPHQLMHPKSFQNPLSTNSAMKLLHWIIMASTWWTEYKVWTTPAAVRYDCSISQRISSSSFHTSSWYSLSDTFKQKPRSVKPLICQSCNAACDVFYCGWTLKSQSVVLQITIMAPAVRSV